MATRRAPSSRINLAKAAPVQVSRKHLDATAGRAAGVVVSSGNANAQTGRDGLVKALLHRFTTLSTMGGELRPGIVHRLDRFTSGVLLVAKNDAAFSGL